MKWAISPATTKAEGSVVVMIANCAYFTCFSRILILLCSIYNTVGDKADDMCREYSEYVYEETAVPVLLPGVNKEKVSHCGIVEVPLIVGGEKAGPKEFPHMVALGYSGGGGGGGGGGKEQEPTWMCGGALISPRFVLTAAHCLKSRAWGEVQWARVGAASLDADAEGDEAAPQVLRVQTRLAHPSYRPPANYHDIGLLRLAGDARLDAFTRPACLNTRRRLPPQARSAVAVGFGRLGYDTDKTSRDLLKVSLPLIGDAQCNESFKFDVRGRVLPRGIADTQLCAGEMAGGKDTCQGDSGGPLQLVLEEPYCMYSIIGITSFGKFCGMANSPAVYTRVSSYVSWIESIVWS